MAKELVKKEEPMTPGYGVAGLVLCPFIKGTCQKSACELWVELKYEDTFVARCSLAWLAVLATETRQAIDKLKKVK